jgi:hypothetical protein
MLGDREFVGGESTASEHAEIDLGGPMLLCSQRKRNTRGGLEFNTMALAVIEGKCVAFEITAG